MKKSRTLYWRARARTHTHTHTHTHKNKTAEFISIIYFHKQEKHSVSVSDYAQDNKVYWLECLSPGLTLNTPYLAQTVYLCVPYGYQNKHLLFPYTAFTDCLFQWVHAAFSAR